MMQDISQNSGGGGGDHEIMFGLSCCESVAAGGEGLLLLWRMETLTKPDSILPAWSRWQRSDKLPLDHSQRVPCPVLSDWNDFPVLSTSLAYFQTTAHRSVSALWICTLTPLSSDKASVLTGFLLIVALFPFLNPLRAAGVAVNRHFVQIAPEWTLWCHTNIIASTCVTYCGHRWLAGCLCLSTHSIHTTVAVHLNTKSEFGWKPWQWLVTTAVTLLHRHHSIGQIFCRHLQNHTVFLHWFPKMHHSMVL